MNNKAKPTIEDLVVALSALVCLRAMGQETEEHRALRAQVERQLRERAGEAP